MSYMKVNVNPRQHPRLSDATDLIATGGDSVRQITSLAISPGRRRDRAGPFAVIFINHNKDLRAKLLWPKPNTIF